jgi:transcriptional regulator with XRE-family HTH domain
MVNKNESTLFYIARRVQQLRSVRGQSQDGFARLVGCHRSLVSHVERGVRNLSLNTLDRFATALCVDAVSLFQGSEVPLDVHHPTPLRERVSANVLALRSERGLSQDVLSERAGLSRNYVSALEVRKQNADLRHLEELAGALGVPVSALFAPPSSEGTVADR